MFQTNYKKITRILLIIAGILLVLAIIVLQIIPKDSSLNESIKTIAIPLLINIISSIIIISLIDFKREATAQKELEEKRKFIYSQLIIPIHEFDEFILNMYKSTVTYDEMKRADQFCANYPDQALQEFLSEYLERQNTLLDIASNNSDVLMRMTDEDTTLVYHFIYDKSYSMGGNKPISNLREQYDLAYNALKKDACTLPIFFGLKEICQKTERKLHFRCKDWKKNDSLEFIIY